MPTVSLDDGKPAEERFEKELLARGYTLWHNSPYAAILARYKDVVDPANSNLGVTPAINRALQNEHSLTGLSVRSDSDWCLFKRGGKKGDIPLSPLVKVETKGYSPDDTRPNLCLEAAPIIRSWVRWNYLREEIYFVHGPRDETAPMRITHISALVAWLDAQFNASAAGYNPHFAVLWRYDSKTIDGFRSIRDINKPRWRDERIQRSSHQDPFLLVPLTVVETWPTLDDVFGPPLARPQQEQTG